jgi:hypothetical protein
MSDMEKRLQQQEQQVQKVISDTPNEAEQIDAIARIRGWFRPSEESIFYPAIRAYLNLEANLSKTNRAIIDSVDAAAKANKLKDVDLTDLWYSILHAAKRTPVQQAGGHKMLVDLMKTLDQESESDRDAQSVFSKLRGFSMASREALNDSPGSNSGYTQPEVHAWTNLQYFFALLTNNGVFETWIYCIWEMRTALENVQKDDGPDTAQIPGTAKQKYDARIPAAATWISGAGRKLYAKEEDLTPSRPNQGNPGKGGELWKGKAELSKERWALWKKRFGEIGNLEEPSEETRKAAKDAVKAMNAIERC